MALSPAPHPIGVFRYLKQAWREWLATGGAATVTVNVPATQPAANPLTVTGTVVLDVSVPRPVQVFANLNAGGVAQAQQMTYTDRFTGAWSVTYPGGSTGATTLATASVAVWVGDGEIGSGSTLSYFTLT